MDNFKLLSISELDDDYVMLSFDRAGTNSYLRVPVAKSLQGPYEVGRCYSLRINIKEATTNDS